MLGPRRGKESDYVHYLFRVLFILSFGPFLSQSIYAQSAEFTTTPPVNSSGVVEICQGSTITFEDISTGTVILRSWIFPTGTPNFSIAKGPFSITFNNPGRDTVQLSINGGASTKRQPIFIKPKPSIPNFSISPIGTQCGGTLLTFALANVQSGVTYSWKFGDGKTAQGDTVTHKYLYFDNSTHNPTVTLTAEKNGCTSTSNQGVTVMGTPKIDIDDLNSNFLKFGYFKLCNYQNISDTLVLQNFGPTGSNSPISKYLINWGDGTMQETFPNNFTLAKHVYAGWGIFSVRITAVGNAAVNSCDYSQIYTFAHQNKLDSLQSPISITNKSNPQNGCSPFKAIFETNLSGTAPGTIYKWSFYDGSPAEEIINGPNVDSTITHVYTRHSCDQRLSDPVYKKTWRTDLQISNYCDSYNPLSVSVKVGQKANTLLTPNKSKVCVNDSICFTHEILEGYNKDCDTTVRALVLVNFGDRTSTRFAGTKGSKKVFCKTYSTTGVFPVTAVTSGLCGPDTVTRYIEVVDDPLAILSTKFVRNTSNCVPSIIELDDLTIGDHSIQWSIWPLTGWSILSGNLNTDTPKIEITRAGTYYIELRTQNACGSDIAYDTVRIISAPKITTKNDSFCLPPVQIKMDSLIGFDDGGDSNLSYNWTHGSGVAILGGFTTKDPFPLFRFNQIGIHNLIIEVSNSCGSSKDTVQITISGLDTPFAGNDRSICFGDTLSLVGSSNNNGIWKDMNGRNDTVSIDGVFTPSLPGVYSLVYSLTSRCGGSDTVKVRVNPLPSPTFSIGSNFCSGDIVPLAASNNSQANVSKITWTVTNNSGLPNNILSNNNIPNPIITFPSNPGGVARYTIMVALESDSGCIGTYQKDVQLIQEPKSIFSIPDSICQGGQFNAINKSTPAGLNYTWSSSNSAITIVNPTDFQPTFFIPKNSGPLERIDTIFLIAGGSCKDTSRKTLIIYPEPIVSFSAPTSGCEPLILNPKNHSDPQNNEPLGTMPLKWYINGVLQTSSPPFRLSNSGTTTKTYTIRLEGTTQHECEGAFEQKVDVYPNPIVSFTRTDTIFKCKNAILTSSDLAFNNSPNSNDTILWYIDGSLLGTGPTFPSYNLAVAPKIHTIWLVAKNRYDCKPDTATRIVRVLDFPDPDFTIIPDSGCNPLKVILNPTSSGAKKYTWKKDNVAFSTSKVDSLILANTSTQDKSYAITLEIENQSGNAQCPATKTKQVIVWANPDLKLPVPPVVCPYDTLFLKNLSNTSPALDTSSFNWWVDPVTGISIDDPNASKGINLTFLDLQGGANKSFYVFLSGKTTNGCSDTVSRKVTLSARPIGNITGDTITCGSKSIILSDNSQLGQSREWRAPGSLSISSTMAKTVTITYPAQTGLIAKSYLVTLVSLNNDGCVDSVDQQIIVRPSPKAAFMMDKDRGCGPLMVTFTDTSTAEPLATYTWDFGNGSGPIKSIGPKSPIIESFTNTSSGLKSYHVSLTIDAEPDCKSVFIDTVTVHPNPIADFDTTTLFRCQGSQIGNADVAVVDYPIANGTYTWYVNDTFYQTGLILNSYVLQYAPAIVTFKLVVENQWNCKPDSLIKLVHVLKSPDANFSILPDTTGCSPLIINLKALESGLDYSWDLGNGTNMVTTCCPMATYTNTGFTDKTYTITLRGTRSQGGANCPAISTRKVIVYANPDLAISAPSILCPYDTLKAINRSSQIPVLDSSSYNWSVVPNLGTTVILSRTADTACISFPDLQNSSNLNYTVNFDARTKKGCYGQIQEPITVSARPLARITGDTITCGSKSVILRDSSDLGFARLWKAPGNISISNSSSKSVTIKYPPRAGSTDTSYTVSLISFNQDGCVDSTTQIVVVKPSPIAAFLMDKDQGCHPLDVTFQDAADAEPMATFIWDMGDGSQPISSIGPRTTFSHLFKNNTTNIENYVIKLLINSKPDCQSVFIDTVTVHPNPIADFDTTTLFRCQGSQIGNADVAVVDYPIANGTYTWYVNDTFYQIGRNLNTYVLSNAPAIVTFKLVVENQWGCKPDSAVKLVHVLKSPEAGFSILPDTAGCSPLIVNLQPQESGLDYSWDLGNGSGAVMICCPIVTYSNAGFADKTYTITLTGTRSQGGTNCPAIATRKVIVYGNPNLSVQTVSKICPYDTLKAYNVSAQIPPLDPLSYNWSISPNVGTTLNLSSNKDTACFTFPDLQNTNNKFYDISFSARTDKGCIAEITKQVEVSARPRARITGDTITCGSKRITIKDESFRGGTRIWSAPGVIYMSDTTDINFTIAYPARFGSTDTAYMVQLRVYGPDGCIDTTSVLITVKPSPLPKISMNKDHGCRPLVVQFSDSSDAEKPYNITWNFGDGTISNLSAPIHTYQGSIYSDTCYTVTLNIRTATNCEAEVSDTICIEPNPVSKIAVSDTSVCVDNTGTASVSIKNISYGSPDTFYWDYGNGSQAIYSEATDTTIRFRPGRYIITLKAVNKCGFSIDSLTLIVLDTPTPRFYLVKRDTACCGPLTVDVYADTLIINTTYTIHFGQGDSTVVLPFGNLSNALVGTVVYHADTVRFVDSLYFFKVIATNECGSGEYLDTIRVRPPPLSVISADTSIGCAPLKVRFSNYSRGSDNTYKWLFGNGDSLLTTSDSSFNYIYYTGSRTDTIIPMLIAQNDCGIDTSEMEIIVLTNTVTPVIDINGSQKIACQRDTVTFTNNSSGATVYRWDWGDGTSTTQNAQPGPYTIQHYYTKPGKFLVTLFASNGCSDTSATELVDILPEPLTDLPNAPAGLCLGNALRLAAPVNTFLNSTSSYSWDMGDGTLLFTRSISHVYSNPGSYTIRLSIQSKYQTISCSKDTVFSIKIADPMAGFNLSDSLGCEGSLFANLFNDSRDADTYLWDLGDGSFSTSSTSVFHLYTSQTLPRIFTIQLIAKSNFGCADTVISKVFLAEPVVSSFEIDKAQGCKSLNVSFTNFSKGADSILWNFGDGSTSTIFNPTHEYSFNNSPFTVSLVAFGNFGCSDTLNFTDTIQIFKPPIADFEPDDSLKLIPFYQFFFYNRSITDIPNYRWDFGDGKGTSLEIDPYYTYADTGCYMVQLIATNSNFCKDTFVKKVRVEHVVGKLYVPNAFTPNSGPYELRSFLPIGIAIKEYQLEVFNTWGERLFLTNKLDEYGRPSEPWDGTFNGKDCPQDTYVWKIYAKFYDGTEWGGQLIRNGSARFDERSLPKVGTITIIR